MGRLAEIIDSALAAAELHRRAKQAANEVARVGKLTVQEGNPGDDAVNDWIEKVMVLYREITGNEPRTSVGGPDKPNEGIAAGPLIRFLATAGQAARDRIFRGRLAQPGAHSPIPPGKAVAAHRGQVQGPRR